MKTLLFTSITLLAVILICCSDNTVSNNINNNNDPGIWLTDSVGNSLGGDTTDWCYHGTCNSYILPAFPNPTNNKVTFQFHLGTSDTVSLYALRNPNDTIFIIKNVQRQAGDYRYWVYADSLNLHNVTTRFYFKIKNKLCPIVDPLCNFYGDVKFN